MKYLAYNYTKIIYFLSEIQNSSAKSMTEIFLNLCKQIQSETIG